MQATITKDLGEFAASHHLPDHAGKCASPHGHNYRVVVEVHDEVLVEPGDSSNGMVIDFGEVSEAWKHIKPFVDHVDLNEALGVGGRGAAAFGEVCEPTTAENLAGWLLRAFITCGVDPTAVRVYETATGCAEVRSEWLDR